MAKKLLMANQTRRHKKIDRQAERDRQSWRRTDRCHFSVCCHDFWLLYSRLTPLPFSTVWTQWTSIGLKRRTSWVPSLKTTWMPTRQLFLPTFLLYFHFILFSVFFCFRFWYVKSFFHLYFEHKKSFALQRNITQIVGHFHLWNVCGIL